MGQGKDRETLHSIYVRSVLVVWFVWLNNICWWLCWVTELNISSVGGLTDWHSLWEPSVFKTQKRFHGIAQRPFFIAWLESQRQEKRLPQWRWVEQNRGT